MCEVSCDECGRKISDLEYEANQGLCKICIGDDVNETKEDKIY